MKQTLVAHRFNVCVWYVCVYTHAHTTTHYPTYLQNDQESTEHYIMINWKYKFKVAEGDEKTPKVSTTALINFI